MQQKIHAFSLVELSIVLVILGLLTGGILAGQSLIRASELRAVSTEYNRYVTAVQSFRDKYFALPGDMSNATSFWKAAAVPASCATTPSTSALTCDGDANGTIAWSSLSSYEAFRAWQHLANAGLIEGTYTGTGSTAYTAAIGVNVPPSKLGNAGWTLTTVSYSGDPWIPDATSRHRNFFFFGASNPSEWTYSAALTPTEAWNIDTKMDDGAAGRGKIVAALWDTCTDAASSADTAGQYLLQDASKQCSLIFFAGL